MNCVLLAVMVLCTITCCCKDNFCMITYKYPRPALATDVVAFTRRENQLELILIRRAEEPFKEKWALPGGFLRVGETLEACAQRELGEETGLEQGFISDMQLELFGTYSNPDRDPREHVVSIAFLGLLEPRSRDGNLEADTDATEARWFSVRDLPELAFDHGAIIKDALRDLGERVKERPLITVLMPPRFTLTHLSRAYEAIDGKRRDPGNFRKWILDKRWVRETGG